VKRIVVVAAVVASAGAHAQGIDTGVGGLAEALETLRNVTTGVVLANGVATAAASTVCVARRGACAGWYGGAVVSSVANLLAGLLWLHVGLEANAKLEWSRDCSMGCRAGEVELIRKPDPEALVVAAAHGAVVLWNVVAGVLGFVQHGRVSEGLTVQPVAWGGRSVGLGVRVAGF